MPCRMCKGIVPTLMAEKVLYAADTRVPGSIHRAFWLWEEHHFQDGGSQCGVLPQGRFHCVNKG